QQQQQQPRGIVSFQPGPPAGAPGAPGVTRLLLPRGPPASTAGQMIRVSPALPGATATGAIPVAIMPPGGGATSVAGVRPQLLQQQQQVIRLGSSQQPQFYQLQRATAQQQSQAAASSSVQSQAPPQYQYRIIVPSNTSLRRLSVLSFSSSQVPDLSTATEASLQRLGRFGRLPTAVAAAAAAAAEAENPSQQQRPMYGEGSAYRQAERDEAKKRKHAGALRRFNPFNQPMQLSFTGSGRDAAKKFKGSREGGITANAAYWVFMKSEANNTFEALPADDFYKFVPDVAYRHFNSEEAEEEFNKRDKTLNKYNLMLRHRLNAKDEGGGEEKSAGDKDGDDGEDLDRGDGGGGGGRSSRRSRLQLTDMDEFGDEAGDSDEADADDRDGGTAATSKSGGRSAGPAASSSKKGGAAGGGRGKRRAPRFKRKRKEGQPGSEDEGGGERDPDGEVEDESELDDHEGDELDYLTHSSSGSVSESEKVDIYEEKGLDQEDAMKGLLVSDEEESETEGGAAAGADGEKNGAENDASTSKKSAAGSKPSKSVGKGADEDDGEDGEDEEDSDSSGGGGGSGSDDSSDRKTSKKEKKQQHKKKKKHKKAKQPSPAKETERREALVKRIKEKAQLGGEAVSDGPPAKRQKTSSASAGQAANLIDESLIRHYLGRRPMTLAELSKKLRSKYKKYKETNKSVLCQALAAALTGMFERQAIKKTTVNAECTYSLNQSGGR
ncbi:hypothetical protein BOX15_Mlig017647g2, partial [Macrostomum lignano]